MDERQTILAVLFFGGLSMTAVSSFVLRHLDEQRFVKRPDRASLFGMTILFWDGLGMCAAGALLWLLNWPLGWPFLALAFATMAATTLYGLRQASTQFPPNDR